MPRQEKRLPQEALGLLEVQKILNIPDIRFIQQLLGHEKLETTAIYTQVSIEQLKAVHAKTHPAEVNENTDSQK